MTPIERKRLQQLDNLILHASREELQKIQEIDYQTQMDGLSLYDVYIDSSLLINHSNKKSFRYS